MLTSDLVRVRRSGGRLSIVRLSDAARTRVLALSERYLAIVKLSVGRTREELDEAWASVAVEARDRKLAGGLRKLILDRCEFEVEDGCDPVVLRRAVFERAAAVRMALAPGEPFDRAAVLAQVAADPAFADAIGAGGGQAPDDAAATTAVSAIGRIDRRLYADLRGAHRLLGWKALSPAALLARYELGQAQAVLLRATRVEAIVGGAAPGVYRALFRKLKFLQLLYRLEARPEGGYHIVIDGPFSLFRSATKYGLKFALLLPALQACARWSLRAEVLWGADRRRYELALDGAAASGDSDGDGADARLPDDVAGLLARFGEHDSAWDVAPARDILDLPGVGLCVPDLVFTHRETGECVFFEALGFWSRDAVWRRVELVEAGLPYKIVFAVSSRLRVSEEVLPADLPGALYVYKGVMSARQVAERLDRVAAASAPAP